MDIEYGFRPSVCRFYGNETNSSYGVYYDTLPIENNYGLKSDMSLHVAKIRDIKLTFNTYEKSTFEKNKYYVALPMSTKNFILEGFKTIELNRLYFVNSDTWDDQTKSGIIRSVFRVQRSFLNSKFSLIDCKIHPTNLLVTF